MVHVPDHACVTVRDGGELGTVEIDGCEGVSDGYANSTARGEYSRASSVTVTFQVGKLLVVFAGMNKKPESKPLLRGLQGSEEVD